MNNLENNKLTNEEMELVTGGTRDQTIDVRRALYNSGTIPRAVELTEKKMITILDNNHIKATFNKGDKGNVYTCRGKHLSQNELLDKIYNHEIMW